MLPWYILQLTVILYLACPFLVCMFCNTPGDAQGLPLTLCSEITLADLWTYAGLGNKGSVLCKASALSTALLFHPLACSFWLLDLSPQSQLTPIIMFQCIASFFSPYNGYLSPFLVKPESNFYVCKVIHFQFSAQANWS